MAKVKKYRKKLRRVRESTNKAKGRVKTSTKKFREEFKKSINTAIVAAFGFLIALTWKDVITEYVNELTAASPVQGKLVSAFIITFIGVLGILVSSKLLSPKE